MQKNSIGKFDGEVIFLLVFILIAFLVRYLFYLSQWTYALDSDSAIYMSMARSLSEGNIFRLIHPWWMPFYPLTAFFVHMIFTNWAVAARMTSLIAGSFLVIPVFYLTKQTSNKTGAIFSVFLITISLPLVYASVQPLTEMLLTFLLWFSVMLLFFCIKRKSFLIVFFCGFSCACLALTKSEGVIITGVFLCAESVITFLLLISKRMQFRQFSGFLGCFFIGFFLLYIPDQLLLKQKFHQSAFTAKASAAVQETDPFRLTTDFHSTWAQDTFNLDTYNSNSEFAKGFFGIMKQKFPTYITDTIIRLQTLTRVSFIPFLTAPGMLLAGMGILSIVARRQWIALWILYFSPILSFIVVMFFAPDPEVRYAVWFLPLLAIGIGTGAGMLVETCTGIYKRYGQIAVLLLFLLVMVFTNTVSPVKLYQGFRTPQSIRWYPEDVWLAKHAAKQRIFMRHEGFGFLSSAFIVYTPSVKTLQELQGYAHQWHVKYLVAHYGEVPAELNYLVKTPKDYQGLQLVVNKKYIIYKII